MRGCDCRLSSSWPVRLFQALEADRRERAPTEDSANSRRRASAIGGLSVGPQRGPISVRISLPGPKADAAEAVNGLARRGDWPLRSRRQRIVMLVLGALGLALTGRLVQLQVFEAGRLAERANRQRSYVDVLPASPGDLLDRDGRVLATTVKTPSLFLIPQDISEPWPLSRKLAAALKLDADRLYERIAKEREKRFLWIKRRLTPSEAEAVGRLKLPAGIWGFRDEYLRRYPQGSIAAHVLGLRDIDGKGRGGLEESLDQVLRGQEGRRTLIRDARVGSSIWQTTATSRPSAGPMSARLSMSSFRRMSSANWTGLSRSGNRKGPARSSRTPSRAKSWRWPRGRPSIRTIRRHSRRRCGKTGPWRGCTSRARPLSRSSWRAHSSGA